MFYAIVFKRAFAAGEHWSDRLPEPGKGEKHRPGKHRPKADDPDRKQAWNVGDLYSTGTVIGTLPDHLEAIAFDEAPPAEWIWDRVTRTFVAP